MMRECPWSELLILIFRVNVYVGEAEERLMRTGNHTVRDIYCKVCHTILGWRYVSLPTPPGFSSHGKAILDTFLTIPRMWPTPWGKSTRKGNSSSSENYCPKNPNRNPRQNDFESRKWLFNKSPLEDRPILSPVDPSFRGRMDLCINIPGPTLLPVSFLYNSTTFFRLGVVH